jgi:hypothetical protein
MKDFSDDIAALRQRLDEAHTYLRIDELAAARPQLETEASRPDLWDDPDRARKVNGELAACTDDLELYASLESRIDDADTLFELGREEHDDSVEAEITQALDELRASFGELELRALFTGEHDENDAICEIQSGEGGADAQDWANMLLRMYLRWAERRGSTSSSTRSHPGAKPASPRPRSSSTVATPTAACAPSTASTAWSACRRSTPRGSARRPLPLSRSRRSSRTCPTSRSTTRTCGSTPTAHRVQADSTST